MLSHRADVGIRAPTAGRISQLVSGCGRRAGEGAAGVDGAFGSMQNLVEDFLQYLRHERGQSEQTQKTYAALLGKFVAWAGNQKLQDWRSVELSHLTEFVM